MARAVRRQKSAKASIGKITRRRQPGVPDPVDIHVGNRVRQRRTLMGYSQEKLGEAVGLTFQQIQKYERGANRIGASRLWDISLILEAPIAYFFEDMSSEVGDRLSERAAQVDIHELRAQLKGDPLLKRETLEFVRSFSRIRDPEIRRNLNKFIIAVTKIK